MLAAFGAAAGCAPKGDFDRPRTTFLHQSVLPRAGDGAATLRGEANSSFEYTDRELELRDRSWALFAPQLKRPRFDHWVAEMRHSRIISMRLFAPDREDYVEELLEEDFRSSGARFARLRTDITADRERFFGFIEVANLVARDDRIRERSLERVPDLTEDEREEALERIAENAALVYAVKQAMRERAEMYRYALERLMIETPDEAAILAEEELLDLEAELGLAEPVLPPTYRVVVSK